MTKLAESLLGRWVPAAEVVVTPASLGRFVASQPVVLVADQRLDPGLAGLIVRQAAVHPDQGHDPVAVSPDVINQHRIIAANPGKLAEQEVLAPLDGAANLVGPRELRRCLAAGQLDQGRHAERRGGHAKGMMRADARDDVQVLGVLRRTPRAVGLWSCEQEFTPRSMAAARVDGGQQVREVRDGDGLEDAPGVLDRRAGWRRAAPAPAVPGSGHRFRAKTRRRQRSIHECDSCDVSVNTDGSDLSMAQS